jgi:hypothetical protein
MKKVIAALVAAAFSLTVAGTAMAAPTRTNQQQSSVTKVQADQGTTKKKATKKKTAKKKVAKKKAPAKKAQQTG